MKKYDLEIVLKENIFFMVPKEVARTMNLQFRKSYQVKNSFLLKNIKTNDHN